ncbi:hypothetical protein [Pseudonocardia nigra]|uniref:hypothetical protein n=1 Tax=Pseudonocardia nigra TaxID=1921578 RepID=UPI0027E3ADE9|nr:hypothetical protein [Pseudonocardia nigra]
MSARARTAGTARLRAAGGTAGGGVVAGLYRWIEGHGPHVQVAVWLLLAHEVWPRHPEFLRACVNRSADRLWWIDWTAVRAAFDAGEFHRAGASRTELVVLDLAIELGRDRFMLGALGVGNARAVG